MAWLGMREELERNLKGWLLMAIPLLATLLLAVWFLITRRFSGRTRLIGLGIIVLAGVAAVGAAAYYFVPRTVDIGTTAVVMSTPSQQYVQLTASGYVVAQRRAAVASKASGRLIELNAREGSQLKKGDLIARLDSSDIKAAILGAEAAVHQAEANVRQSTVQLIQARADLARARSLEAQGFVSPQTVENALAKNKAAFAATAAAQAALEQAQAQLKAQKGAQDNTENTRPGEAPQRCITRGDSRSISLTPLIAERSNFAGICHDH